MNDARHRNTVVPAACRRNLRWFYAFRWFATSYLYMPIFMLFLADRGLSYFERLALGGVYSAVVIFAEVPTGVFADTFGRRVSMAVGAVLLMLGCLVMVSANQWWWFAVGETLAALSMAMCSGADSAYLYDYLAAHDASDAYPQVEASASAWHLTGSALAFVTGGVLAEYHLTWPYLATAGVAGAALVCALALDEARPQRPVRIRWSQKGRAAIGAAVRNPRLRWLVVYSAVVFTMVRATNYLYAPYLHAHGAPPWVIGVVYASTYAAAAVVALATPQLVRRLGWAPVAIAVVAVLCLSFAGLGAATSALAIAGVLSIQAVANGMYSPLTKPRFNANIASSTSRAAVLSVESMGRRITMAVFAPLAGAVGQAWTPWLAAGLGGLGMLWLWWNSEHLGESASVIIEAAPDVR